MNKTEKKLSDAFDRIQSENTINIAPGKKLSFSSVEDEAKVSRSLLRQYPALFERVKEQILLMKIQKEKKLPNRNKQVQNLKEDLRISRDKIDNLEIKNESLLKANIGMAERIRFLEKELNKKGA